MGNPTILFRKKLDTLWVCRECGNRDEFEEEWFVEIIQDLDNNTQEINLIESLNLRCKRCGSNDIGEMEEKCSYQTGGRNRCDQRRKNA